MKRLKNPTVLILIVALILGCAAPATSAQVYADAEDPVVQETEENEGAERPEEAPEGDALTEETATEEPAGEVPTETGQTKEEPIEETELPEETAYDPELPEETAHDSELPEETAYDSAFSGEKALEEEVAEEPFDDTELPAEEPDDEEGPAEEEPEEAEETAVEIAWSPEEAAAMAPMADTEAFFTIDAETGDVSGEAVFEDFTEEQVAFEEVVAPTDSTEVKQDKIVATVEENDLFTAEVSEDGGVEVTSIFSNQRLIMPGTYSETLQTFGAEAAVYYDDRFILTYESPEATAEAYRLLTEEYGEEQILIDYPLALTAEGWGYEHMELASGIKQAANGSSILVAVIDSGIRFDHSIFNGTTVMRGRDFANNDNDPSATYFHGTAVAGIIAESTPANVAILPIQVTNRTNVVTSQATDPPGGVAAKSALETIVQALDYAVAQDADLVNISIGGSIAEYTQRPELAKTIPYYINKINAYAVPIICAAGNDNADVDEVYYFPACAGNTICVSGINRDNSRWEDSNYGASVDFAAPASNVQHAIITSANSYRKSGNGTSFATPYITAVAAMILAQHPTYSRSQLYRALTAMCVDLGMPGKDELFGNGCPVFPKSSSTDPSSGSDTEDSAAIARKSISKLTITGPTKRVICTGKAKTPSVKIKDGDRILKKGVDYTLTYTNNVKCGTAKVTIRMKGRYKGSTVRTFRIALAKTSYTGIKKDPVSGNWYRIKKGEIDRKYTGIAKKPETGKWYYVRKGKVRWKYTGVAKYPKNGKWYRVKKGRVDFTFTGVAKRPENNKYYYFRKGRLQRNYSGTATDENGVIYTVTKGKAKPV